MPRKNPYSGKQKKQQLKEKKARKQDGPKYLADWSDDEEDLKKSDQSGAANSVSSNRQSKVPLQLKETDVQKINAQPERNSKDCVNSFRLHFLKEPDDVIVKRKRAARRPIKHLHENDLEYSIKDVYPSHVILDFPKRPSWSYDLSKEMLDNQEKQYFKGYLSEMMLQSCAETLSCFDLNLETWRQLWRVLEISDILLIIADIRYPVLHISPSLVHHIQHVLHKPVILVLNKIDFVPPVIAVAWEQHLQEQFPGIHVVFFSSFVNKNQNQEDVPIEFDPSKALFKKPAKGSTCSLGPDKLYKAVKTIVSDKVDLSSWREHLEEEGFLSYVEASYNLCGINTRESANDSNGERKTDYVKQEYKDGAVTLGCIGYPNVGKSSVLNALKGRKVVSVSQNPGHTKHLQTIFLTPTVRLCDCPGLVFPSVVPKALQVIAGIYPVAQVGEPYSVVQYLAERVDLPALLRVVPPPDRKGYDEGYEWSAFDICEAWAIKCGYFTPKAARPDLYRAANNILRLAVAGQIRLCFRPPAYSQCLDEVRLHPDTQTLHSRLKAGTSRGGCHRDEDEVDREEEDDNNNGLLL